MEAAAADLGYALAPGAPIGVLNAVSRLNQTQIDNLLLGNPACPNTNPSSLNDCQLMYAKLLAAGITTTGAIVAVIQAFPDAAEEILPPPPEPPADDDDTGLPPPVIEPPDGTPTEPMTGSYVRPAWIDSAAGLELRQTLKAELESLGLDPVRIIDTTCGRLLRSSTQMTVEEWHACIALRALARQNGVTADDVISMWMTGYSDSTGGTASTAAGAGRAMRTALNAVLSTIDLPDPAMNGGAGAHSLDDGFDENEIADGLVPFEDYAEAQDVDPAPSGAFEETNESMSARAAAYERQITGTEDGVSYVVQRGDASAVKFDGYRDGVLIEAKGPNLAKFVEASTGEFYGWFRGRESFIDQANRQLDAAGGTSVRWVFAEDRAATAVQVLFDELGLQIEILVVPEN